MNVETIKLTSLFVNRENYRFEPQPSQVEAMKMMADDQGDKLFFLAKDIVENGLSPIDLIMVTPSEDVGKYIVLEGNRRVTSLKFLHTPSLIDDTHISLRKKFQELNKKSSEAISSLKEIPCCIFENPPDADLWIKRRHAGELNGIGTVSWDAQQKQRFEEKTEGKASISLQIVTFLESHEDVPSDIKRSLHSFPVTNLGRLINDRYVRGKLGIEIVDGKVKSNINASEIVKGLVKVVSDIMDPKFSVSDIYTKEQRKSYIDHIDESQKPDLSKTVLDQWDIQDYSDIGKQTSPTPEKTVKKTQNAKQVKQRDTLIPKSLFLPINNARICNLFNELKKLKVYSFPNAVSILYRVFLELSVDAYIDKYKIARNNALTSSSSGEDLRGKVLKVIDRMVKTKAISSELCKGIKTEMKEVHSILSADTLNAYVHNQSFSPKPDNLFIGWNNSEQFFVHLWNDISKPEP